MREREPEWTVRRLSRRKQIHSCLHISSTTSGGDFIPRASAPVSTGCLLLYSGPPGCKLLEETTTSLGTTGGFGTSVCKVDVTANPPGDLSRIPPMCCQSGQAHGGILPTWDPGAGTKVSSTLPRHESITA